MTPPPPAPAPEIPEPILRIVRALARQQAAEDYRRLKAEAEAREKAA